MTVLWSLGVFIENAVHYVIDILVDVFNRYVSASTQIELAPQLSLNILGKFVSLVYLGRNLPPQFNTELEVPGLPKGSVRWFSKALLRQRDDPVVLLLHGGGYALGLWPLHAVQMKEIWDKVENERLSIVWLDYTLSTHARLPKQINEALAVYRELLKTSSNITLLGDSAGGHLSLCLAREAHRQNLPKPSNVVLISPWCSLLPSYTGTYVEHNKSDRLKYEVLLEFGRRAVPIDNPQLASEVVKLSSDPNWAQYLPAYDHVAVLYGDKEILKDDIEEFITKSGIKDKGGFIRREPEGKHDSPVSVGCGPFRLRENLIINELSEFLKQHTE